MENIIKSGNGVWYVVVKEDKFFQANGLFENTLTQVVKYIDYNKACNVADNFDADVKTLETEFKIY